MCFFAMFQLIGCSKNKEKPQVASITESVTVPDLANGDRFLNEAKYDSALYHYLKAQNLFLSNNKKVELIDVLIKISDLQRLKGTPEEALITINKIEELIDEKDKDDWIKFATVLHKKALLLIDKGIFDEAISLLNRSIDFKVKRFGQKDTSLSLSYNGLGTAFFYKGDYNNALKNYSLAYNIALQKRYPEDADLAMFMQNIGIINAQKGDYEKAEEAFTTSLKINEKVLKSDDPELAMINLNVGRLKALLNKDLEALDFYNKAEEIIAKKSEPEHPYYIYIYSNKGQTYVHLADYEKALIFFNKALALANSTLDNKHPQILSLNMNIGYVYEKKKEFGNALKYYLASLPEDAKNPSVIKTYGNLASLYSSMNDKSKANEYYLKSLSLAENFYGKDHPETGLLYTRYGYFLLSDPHINDEIAFFNKALAISLKNYGLKSREVSNNYTHIGNVYLMNNEFDKALSSYQKAIISIVDDFNDNSIEVNPNLEKINPDRYLVNALSGKAEAFALKGGEKNLSNSLSSYKLSIQIIDKLRSTYQDEESKLLISEEAKTLFQKTVDVAVKLYNTTGNKKYLSEAFQYSDKSKSAVLINSVKDIEAQYFGKIPQNIVNLEKKLKLSIGTFRRFIYEEKQKINPDGNKISEFESKVFDFSVRYDSLIRVLEKQYPDYYKLKYSEPVVEIHNIQTSLEKDRLLIEYMITDSVLHIFAINRSSFEIFSQKIDSSFFWDITTIVATTSNNSMGSTTDSDFRKYALAANRLYNTLIEPVKEKFHENKLIIIPDGEIGYISFDMLLTELPDTTIMDYRRLPYMIEKNIVSYSTSALFQFNKIRKRDASPTRNVLAMAPSYDNLVKDGKTTFIDDNGKNIYLLPIPGVEKEMEGIGNSLFSKKIRGDKATESKFKKEVGKYNVLHLAMHTLINNNQPMLSKLVFYQNNDTIEDGMLNTYELFSMDLNANLAVLSACNTGSGKLIKGEGIMNLARGFIFAGVPSIVMTMWSVDDQSSALIVKNFYQYLEKGLSKDEALRQSKLDLLKEGDPLRSHPFYWAAYVNIGDNSPVKFHSVLFTYVSSGITILLVVLIILFLKKRKKAKAVMANDLA